MRTPPSAGTGTPRSFPMGPPHRHGSGVLGHDAPGLGGCIESQGARRFPGSESFPVSALGRCGLNGDFWRTPSLTGFSWVRDSLRTHSCGLAAVWGPSAPGLGGVAPCPELWSSQAD